MSQFNDQFARDLPYVINPLGVNNDNFPLYYNQLQDELFLNSFGEDTIVPEVGYESLQDSESFQLEPVPFSDSQNYLGRLADATNLQNLEGASQFWNGLVFGDVAGAAYMRTLLGQGDRPHESLGSEEGSIPSGLLRLGRAVSNPFAGPLQFLGITEASMPEDIEEYLEGGPENPDFDRVQYFKERIAENPLLGRYLQQAGVDEIRVAQEAALTNERKADFFLRRAVAQTSIQQRLQVARNEYGDVLLTAASLPEGIANDPDSYLIAVPVIGGVGALLKGGVVGVGKQLGLKLGSEALESAAKSGLGSKVFNLATMNAVWDTNNSLLRNTATMFGAGALQGGISNIADQNQRIALAGLAGAINDADRNFQLTELVWASVFGGALGGAIGTLPNLYKHIRLSSHRRSLLNDKPNAQEPGLVLARNIVTDEARNVSNLPSTSRFLPGTERVGPKEFLEFVRTRRNEGENNAEAFRRVLDEELGRTDLSPERRQSLEDLRGIFESTVGSANRTPGAPTNLGRARRKVTPLTEQTLELDAETRARIAIEEGADSPLGNENIEASREAAADRDYFTRRNASHPNLYKLDQYLRRMVQEGQMEEGAYTIVRSVLATLPDAVMGDVVNLTRYNATETNTQYVRYRNYDSTLKLFLDALEFGESAGLEYKDVTGDYSVKIRDQAITVIHEITHILNDRSSARTHVDILKLFSSPEHRKFLEDMMDIFIDHYPKADQEGLRAYWLTNTNEFMSHVLPIMLIEGRLTDDIFTMARAQGPKVHRTMWQIFKDFIQSLAGAARRRFKSLVLDSQEARDVMRVVDTMISEAEEFIQEGPFPRVSALLDTLGNHDLKTTDQFWSKVRFAKLEVGDEIHSAVTDFLEDVGVDVVQADWKTMESLLVAMLDQPENLDEFSNTFHEYRDLLFELEEDISDHKRKLISTGRINGPVSLTPERMVASWSSRLNRRTRQHFPRDVDSMLSFNDERFAGITDKDEFVKKVSKVLKATDEALAKLPLSDFTDGTTAINAVMDDSRFQVNPEGRLVYREYFDIGSTDPTTTTGVNTLLDNRLQGPRKTSVLDQFFEEDGLREGTSFSEVAAAIMGDSDALKELSKSLRMSGAISSIQAADAEDAVQDALLSLLASDSILSPEKTKSPTSLMNLVRTTAVRRAVDSIREVQGRGDTGRVISYDALVTDAGTDLVGDEGGVLSSNVSGLETAAGEAIDIPTDQAVTFLKVLEILSDDNSADILKLSDSTAKTSARRRAFLKVYQTRMRHTGDKKLAHEWMLDVLKVAGEEAPKTINENSLARAWRRLKGDLIGPEGRVTKLIQETPTSSIEEIPVRIQEMVNPPTPQDKTPAFSTREAETRRTADKVIKHIETTDVDKASAITSPKKSRIVTPAGKGSYTTRPIKDGGSVRSHASPDKLALATGSRYLQFIPEDGKAYIELPDGDSVDINDFYTWYDRLEISGRDEIKRLILSNSETEVPDIEEKILFEILRRMGWSGIKQGDKTIHFNVDASKVIQIDLTDPGTPKPAKTYASAIEELSDELVGELDRQDAPIEDPQAMPGDVDNTIRTEGGLDDDAYVSDPATPYEEVPMTLSERLEHEILADPEGLRALGTDSKILRDAIDGLTPEEAFTAIHEWIKEHMDHWSGVSNETIAQYWRMVDELRASQLGLDNPMTEVEIHKAAAEATPGTSPVPIPTGEGLESRVSLWREKMGEESSNPLKRRTADPSPPTDDPTPTFDQKKAAFWEDFGQSRDGAVRLQETGWISRLFAGAKHAEGEGFWRRLLASGYGLIYNKFGVDQAYQRFSVTMSKVALFMMDDTHAHIGNLVAPGTRYLPNLTRIYTDSMRPVRNIARAHARVSKKLGYGPEATEVNRLVIRAHTLDGRAPTIDELKDILPEYKGDYAKLLEDLDNYRQQVVRYNQMILRLEMDTGWIGPTESGGGMDPTKYWPSIFKQSSRTDSKTNWGDIAKEIARVRKDSLINTDRLDSIVMMSLGFIQGQNLGKAFGFGEEFIGLRGGFDSETLGNLKVLGEVTVHSTAALKTLRQSFGSERRDVFFVHQGGMKFKVYQVPRNKKLLSKADLDKYHSAINENKHLTSAAREALKESGNDTIVDMMAAELVRFKRKVGIYARRDSAMKTPDATFISLMDPRVSKLEGFEDQWGFSVQNLTWDEIRNSSRLMDVMEDNGVAAYSGFMRSRLFDLMFQETLDRLVGFTGYRPWAFVDDAQARAFEEIEGLSPEDHGIARDSVTAAMTRFRQLYQEQAGVIRDLDSNVDRIGAAIWDTTGALLRGSMGIGFGLAGMVEAGVSLTTKYANLSQILNLPEMTRDFVALFRHFLGDLRFSGDKVDFYLQGLLFDMENLKSEDSNRYLGEHSDDIDTKRNWWKRHVLGGRASDPELSAVRRGAHMVGNIGMELGGLGAVTQWARRLHMSRLIREVRHLVDGKRYDAMLNLIADIESRKLELGNLVEEASVNREKERELFKDFKAAARAAGWGGDWVTPLRLFQKGLSSRQDWVALKWMFEQFDGKPVNALKLQELAWEIKAGKHPNSPTFDSVHRASGALTHYFETAINRGWVMDQSGMSKITGTEARTAMGRFMNMLFGFVRMFGFNMASSMAVTGSAALIGKLGLWWAWETVVAILRSWAAGEEMENILEDIEEHPEAFAASTIGRIPLFGSFTGWFDALLRGTAWALTGDEQRISGGLAPSLSLPANELRGVIKHGSQFVQSAAEGTPEYAELLKMVGIDGLVNKGFGAITVRTLEEMGIFEEQKALQGFLDSLQRTPLQGRRQAVRRSSGSIDPVGVQQTKPSEEDSRVFNAQVDPITQLGGDRPEGIGSSTRLADLLR